MTVPVREAPAPSAAPASLLDDVLRRVNGIRIAHGADPLYSTAWEGGGCVLERAFEDLGVLVVDYRRASGRHVEFEHGLGDFVRDFDAAGGARSPSCGCLARNRSELELRPHELLRYRLARIDSADGLDVPDLQEDRICAPHASIAGVIEEDERHLLAAIELAGKAREHGNHPFGALLVDADGNVVLEAENTVVTERDCTGHAESNLLRMASARFTPEFLERCTLYTSTEPCAMCAGAIHWGNVRRVVFALSEEELRAIVGRNPENPTLALPCREVFARGQHEIEVSGPHLREQALAVHAGFWDLELVSE